MPPVQAKREFDVALAEAELDVYGSEREQDWLTERNHRTYTSVFLDTGYFVLPIPREITKDLLQFFDEKCAAPFVDSDIANGYVGSKLTTKTVQRLNKENIYFGKPNTIAINALEGFLKDASSTIEEQVAQHWRVINVRAWQARPGTNFWPERLA